MDENSIGLKQPDKKIKITININNSSIEYFKALAKDMGIPYQSLINMYLSDCVAHQLRPNLNWSNS